MERAIFAVPKLYADHHVLNIRKLLGNLSGVQNVEASAAFKRVAVSFDPDAISAESIAEALQEAGYGPDHLLEFAQALRNKEDGSFWYVLQPRTTETNQLDIEMSGDFRKY
jgi:copper chaperone CopZ